ncbi:S phase cyclin A-associated protein in the endoplasmic reticulum-like isoform X2 [Xenia sp. Carnegie-2017]|uniref:S phase cyclin A-associated protein in the endoplasmic reticulum-like isoform X2 n=1 Tax=Xenia sp. Carnegie-2017 TaxID=2897299 RepID=UPI001F042302|nr:S phase cyclin A-associated protein in the endoplasmic reticulum-like isoform X2 [Xenia sp. Carnegie-2017]
MSHVEKNDRRRPNGLESNGHKARAERYRSSNKKNLSPKTSHKGLDRSNNQDHIRRLVEKEGRVARNLVTFSVPVSDQRNVKSDQSIQTSRTDGENREKEKSNVEKREISPSKSKTRSRSNSANRKKIDLRARYWSYLFDNLKRAVDEIYTTCESDESVMECQEVIMMLDQCRNDFQSLIDRIHLHAAFEKADSKDRPQSLAWAVRKLSPGKYPISSPPPVFSSRKRRPLMKTLELEETSVDGVMSWADRVKGRTSVSDRSTPKTMKKNEENLVRDKIVQNGFVAIQDGILKVEEDDGGWETVRYSKKTKATEKCSGARDRSPESYAHSVEPRVLRVVTDNGDLSPTAKHVSEVESFNECNNETIADVREAKIRISNSTCADANTKDSFICKDKEFDKDEMSVVSTEMLLESSIKEQATPPVTLNVADVNSSVEKGKSDKNEKLKGFLSPLNVDSDVDTDEDGLTASDVEHQAALSAAIEEEADLSKQYETERDEFLASAKEHEEKLAIELADQEAYVNAMNNVADGDDEAGEVQDDNKEEKSENDKNPRGSVTRELTWEEMIAEYDEKNKREGSPSWGDIVEMSESRPPGRAVQIHQRLSSPSRKRDVNVGVQKQAEKQAKAQQLRKQLLDDKLQHLQNLSEKVEKARELKMMLIGEQELHQKEKQRKVEEKRNIKLKEIVRKAQEEDAKVNEIAFINSLEAQNKKIEVLSRYQDHEARLQDLQEERQRKRDEQQAKEAAAYERRKQLEAERKARLEEMKQRRQEQEAKFLREKQEKEKAREEAAKERAREREQRLAARNEALQTAVEQLQLKIKQKQQESTKRHEQILELVKEKAAGASRHSTQDDLPAVTPYERKKICTLCNVQIISEVYLVSHLRGNKHKMALDEVERGKKIEDYDALSLQYIKDVSVDKVDENAKASDERKTAFKKRVKKIRHRMASRGREYEATLTSVEKRSESSKKSKLQKVIKDLDRYFKNQSTGPWAANRVAALERSLSELSRLMEGNVEADQVTFCNLGGLSTLSRILLQIEFSSGTQKSFLPIKTLCSVVSVMTIACVKCFENCWYVLLSNKLTVVVDLLAHNLAVFSCVNEKKSVESNLGRSADAFLLNLQHLLSTAIHSLIRCDAKDISCVPDGLDHSVAMQRITDLISYIVCSGVIDNLQAYFGYIGGSNDNDSLISSGFVLESLDALCSIARVYSVRVNDVFTHQKREDTSQFLVTVKHTGLAGVISLLYSVLLRDGLKAPSKIPEQLSEEMNSMATKGLRFLNFLATGDFLLVQDSLGCEGISLQFRHIVAHILRVCSAETNHELLHEVILIIGYFTVLNPENQVFVLSGRSPTLLQKLCSLPFQYFSNPRLRNILFPTLICACYENEQNKEILEQEVSCALLSNYLEDQSLDFQQDKMDEKPRSIMDEMSRRIMLSQRFPVSRWKHAQEFLQNDKR